MTRKELEALHDLSDDHKNEVLKSSFCGCFYCLQYFHPKQIKEWIDGGQTALCFYCGIDSVLCNVSVPKLNKKILKEMNAYWFKVVAIKGK